MTRERPRTPSQHWADVPPLRPFVRLPRTLLTKAIQLATEAHRDQVDKLGEPYIWHPMRVMSQMIVDGETDVVVLAAAVLHDTLEDTWVTMEDIQSEVDWPVADLVSRLTREHDVTYAEYIETVKLHPVTRLIKMADIWDNMNPSRMAKLAAIDRKTADRLLRKYRQAWMHLLES